MARRLLLVAPRKVSIGEYELPEVNDNSIKVRTIVSGISHGTELSIYRGTNMLFHSKGMYTVDWSWRKKLVEGYSYPLEFGYDQVGQILEVGRQIENYKPGEIIASAYGHKDFAVIGPYNLVRVPDGLSPEEASFRALGCIALSGLHKLGVNVGDDVAVFGLGAIGLIAVQLVRMSGAGTVFAVGKGENRLRLAQKFGADYIIDASSQDGAKEIRRLTDNKGADASIELSGSLSGLSAAIKSTAHLGKVLVIGVYDKPIDDIVLGNEFHYNEIQLIQSQGEGLPPDPFRHWNVERCRRTVLSMIKSGSLKVKELISHRFRFEDAEKAYHLIDEKKEPVVRVILTF